MKLKGPEGCQGVTLMDVYYKADADGLINVPDIPHNLLNEGFSIHIPAKPKKSVKDAE